MPNLDFKKPVVVEMVREYRAAVARLDQLRTKAINAQRALEHGEAEVASLREALIAQHPKAARADVVKDLDDETVVIE